MKRNFTQIIVSLKFVSCFASVDEPSKEDASKSQENEEDEPAPKEATETPKENGVKEEGHGENRETEESSVSNEDGVEPPGTASISSIVLGKEGY